MTIPENAKNIKPWEHRIELGVNKTWTFADGPAVDGMIAACTCGNFEFPFAEGMHPAEVLDRTISHTEMHPLPPVSRVELGNGDYVLVMAVPGPENNPVHMSITVPKVVYEDGEALARYLGPIGSPMHFAASEQRADVRDIMRRAGFRVMEMPLHAEGIKGIFDMFKNGMPGPEAVHMTGFANTPDVPTIEYSTKNPNDNDNRPDFDDPDEYAP